MLICVSFISQKSTWHKERGNNTKPTQYPSISLSNLPRPTKKMISATMARWSAASAFLLAVQPVALAFPPLAAKPSTLPFRQGAQRVHVGRLHPAVSEEPPTIKIAPGEEDVLATTAFKVATSENFLGSPKPYEEMEKGVFQIGLKDNAVQNIVISYGGKARYPEKITPSYSPPLPPPKGATKEEDALPKEYASDDISNVIKNISFNELYDLAVLKSRPKKKSVSLHSVLATAATMGAIVTILPTFQPGLDEFGYPQIFQNSKDLSDVTLHQVQFMALINLVTSVLGVLRLPPASPPARVNGMVNAAMVAVTVDSVVLSSLNGSGVYSFDAFSLFGRGALILVLVGGLFTSLKSLYEAASDNQKKGWDTIPNYGSRFSAVATNIVLVLLMCTLTVPILVLFSPNGQDIFEDSALPLFARYNGLQTIQFFGVSFAVGIGALLGTLQFERKITAAQAGLGAFFVQLFLTFDSIKYTFYFSDFKKYFPDSPVLAEAYSKGYPQLATDTHYVEITIAATALALLGGLFKLLSDNDAA